MTEKQTIKKTFAIALIIMLVSTLTLAMMRRIPFMYFWFIAAFGAICAYLVLPRLK